MPTIVSQRLNAGRIFAAEEVDNQFLHSALAQLIGVKRTGIRIGNQLTAGPGRTAVADSHRQVQRERDRGGSWAADCVYCAVPGRIRLRAAGYQESGHEKNSEITRPPGDIFNTPVAIVVGTISADPAIREVCARKGDASVRFWKSWQRQPPRIFKDTEISDQDATGYSLILIGRLPTAAASRRREAG